MHAEQTVKDIATNMCLLKGRFSDIFSIYITSETYYTGFRKVKMCKFYPKTLSGGGGG